MIPLSGRMAPNSRVGQGGKGSGLDLFLLALTMLPASDAQLESKASALACRSKAEALDSSGPALRLAGTMTKPDPPGIVGTGKVPRFLRKPSPVQINVA